MLKHNHFLGHEMCGDGQIFHYQHQLKDTPPPLAGRLFYRSASCSSILLLLLQCPENVPGQIRVIKRVRRLDLDAAVDTLQRCAHAADSYISYITNIFDTKEKPPGFLVGIPEVGTNNYRRGLWE